MQVGQAHAPVVPGEEQAHGRGQDRETAEHPQGPVHGELCQEDRGEVVVEYRQHEPAQPGCGQERSV